MTEHDPLMERAKRRAKTLREFYGHLVTYVAVSGLLVVLDLIDTDATGDTFIGLHWAFWPIFGWGFFVLIHGISTAFPMTEWEDRKAREIYEKERIRHLENR